MTNRHDTKAFAAVFGDMTGKYVFFFVAQKRKRMVAVYNLRREQRFDFLRKILARDDFIHLAQLAEVNKVNAMLLELRL